MDRSFDRGGGFLYKRLDTAAAMLQHRNALFSAQVDEDTKKHATTHTFVQTNAQQIPSTPKQNKKKTRKKNTKNTVPVVYQKCDEK